MSELDKAKTVIDELFQALVTARQGLQWYRDSYPQGVDGSDDEADIQFDQAEHSAATFMGWAE